MESQIFNLYGMVIKVIDTLGFMVLLDVVTTVS